MNELIDLIGPVAALAPATVLPAVMILTRLSVVLFLLPGVTMRVVPVRVKAALAMSVTLILLPPLAPLLVGVEGALVTLLLGEAFAGFVLGFFIRVFLFALSIVGTIIAQALSLSQIFGASLSEDANTSISTLLIMTGSVLFLTLDYEVATIMRLIESYETFPPGAVFANNTTGMAAREVIVACGKAFALAVSLSLPFLVLNFAYNVLLGLMNRAMPQLMVTFVGMPAITLAGLLLFVGTSAVILTVWLDQVRTFFLGAAG